MIFLENKLKTALVTGVAGFLGSHLCESLLNDGYKVVGVDNLFTGRQENLKLVQNHPNFKFEYNDICNQNDYHTECYDEIWNLACPASPEKYQIDPIHTMMTNVVGTNNLLELADKHNSKFFQASTSEIYGDPLVSPQHEFYRGNVNTIGPRACYDEGKRAAEALCSDWYRCKGVNVRIARIFNTYGPRMNPYDGRVVSNFIRQALNGDDLTIYGDGSQTRSFCYYTDLISGFRKLMNSNIANNQPVNLGNPNEFTIMELAEMVIKKTGSKSSINFLPLPEDDPLQRRPNITLANQLLEWEPKIQIDEGLDHMIRHYKKVL
jgi:UDP-glucuronate decarboxylase